MMAHEVPLQVHQNNMAPPKTSKHKGQRNKAQLPNGEKPDFGTGKEKQKGRQPQLPNGERPDFGGKNQPKKDQPKKDQPKSNKGSKKPVVKKNNNDTKKADAKSDADGKSAPRPVSNQSGKKPTYAGSSFHSSPEALALPKPSFASQAASSQPGPAQLSPEQRQPQTGARNIMNMPPSYVYQGGSPAAPPTYPVTAYPPGALPGFNYNANKQGFINYSYPPTAVAQPPLPMQAYPFQYPPSSMPPQQQFQGQFQYPQQQPQVQQPNQHPQQQMHQFPQQPVGQRITFNELMGSSK